MDMYKTVLPAGHSGFKGDSYYKILTPDGGVLMASSPADAERIATGLQAGYEAIKLLAAIREVGQVAGLTSTNQSIDTMLAAWSKKRA